MLVTRASRAGFCMGVSLALQKLESAIASRSEKQAARICTLGPIIHNPQVLAHFSRQGVTCLEDAENTQPGDHVLIRAHGIPRHEEQKLRSICQEVEDATCPKVKKAQTAIAEATANMETLLLFGEAEHPEVRGLVSYAQGTAHVFASPAELEALRLDGNASFVLAAQTTQDRELFEKMIESLGKSLSRLRVLRTICDATRQRQEEALRIAGEVDIMIVVGGLASGNTRRLASLSAEAGIRTFHVENVHELEGLAIDPDARIGLTAGASTPKYEIDAVERWLLDYK